MTHERGEKIETIEQLAEWLLRVRPRAICIIAEGQADKAHFAIINGDKQFAVTMALGMDFVGHSVVQLDPSFLDEPEPINRAERRRKGRR